MFTLAPYLLLILLLAWPMGAVGHQIHCIDGRVIETGRIEKKGNRLEYEKFGGTITIPLDQVEKIIYSSGSRTRNYGSRRTRTEDDRNLAARLERVLSPATPIEKANLATVFIRTAAGSGSGFFLDDRGLIVTNRHVVRGSAEQAKQQTNNFREAEQQLDQWKEQLDQQGQRIARAEKELVRREQEITTYAASAGSRPENVRRARESLEQNKQTVRSWQRQYEQQLARYRKKYQEFAAKQGEYRDRTRKLASQNEFSVTLADGTVKQAALYTVSSNLDLALLKIHGFTTPKLEPLATPPPVGTPVYALGSPLGLKGSVTSGVLSAVRRDFLQTNAEIYPGNSGGPLVTEQGRVIGVNTMKMITDKFEGLGFAIPIARVVAEFQSYLDQP